MYLRIGLSSLQEFQKLLFRETRLLDGILQEADLQLASAWEREKAAVRHLDVHMIAFPASLNAPSPAEGPEGLLSSDPAKLSAHILSSPLPSANCGPPQGATTLAAIPGSWFTATSE